MTNGVTEHQLWGVVNRDKATVHSDRLPNGEYTADVRLQWRPDTVLSLRVYWVPWLEQSVWSAQITACLLRWVIVPIGDNNCIWLKPEFFPVDLHKMLFSDSQLMARAADEIEHTAEFDAVAR